MSTIIIHKQLLQHSSYMDLQYIVLVVHLINLLFILPEFLNSEDVEFVSVDVRQETVRLSDRLALRRASAVSHQIHAVTCAQDTDTDRLLVCNDEILQEIDA